MLSRIGILAGSVLLLAGAAFAETNSVENGEIVYLGDVMDLGADGLLGIGQSSANNGLIVTNLGAIWTGDAILGGSASSSDNFLIVTNDGYVDVENTLTVGLAGDMNVVQVSSNAGVYADSLIIGDESGAEDNELNVEGYLWGNTVTVGNEGSDNSMTIGTNGWVVSSNVTVGAESGASGNRVLVSGTNALWLVEDTLTIGATGNENNSVTVTNDSWLILGNTLAFGGATNNVLNIDRDGTFGINSDLDASIAGFNFNEGGRLIVGGTLSGMTNVVEDARRIGLVGEDAEWDLSGSTLSIGGSSSSNMLAVVEGAQLISGSANVGTSSNSFGNLVEIYDSESHWLIESNLVIGAVSNSGNEVVVGEGGKLTIGDAVTIAGTNNLLTLESGGWLVVSNDFDASMAGFDFEGSATLETAGALSGMESALDGNRTVILDGSNATWTTAGSDFYVGSNTSANAVQLKNNALLTSSNASIGHGASAGGNRVEISASTWNISGDLAVGDAGSNNRLSIDDGTVSVSGSTIVGAQGNNNMVSIKGSNTVFMAGTNLVVGQTGSGNSLAVLGGAMLQVTGDSSIGAVAVASGNSVTIAGLGSTWTNSGNLYVGNAGSGSLLSLNDQATLSVGLGLYVQNGSTIRYSGDATAAAGSYFQDATSTLEYDRFTNTADLVVSGTAELQGGATINYTGDIGSLDVGIQYSNLLVSASTLIVGGVTNAADDVSDRLNTDNSGSLLLTGFYAANDDLYARMHRVRLANSAGFEDGSEMASVSDEIDGMVTDGSSRATRQLDRLNKMSGAKQNSQLTQLYSQSAPNYMHMQGMLEGLANVRRRGVLPEPFWKKSPKGANGPHRYGRELYGRQSQLWMKGYGSEGTRDADDSFAGYDQTIYGTIVGADKAAGNVLTGIAGGYTGSNIDQDNGDSSDATTGYGVFYASWGTLDWFSDANISYGRSSVETHSGTEFDTKGKFEADQVAFYLGGGKEFAVGRESFLLTPALALQGSYYSQDAYTESANNAVPRSIDAYDRFNIQSVLGLKAGTLHEFMNTILMPELRINWIHEFNDDQDNVDYSLVGGSGNYSFGMQAPVADVMEFGIGLSARREYEDDEVLEFSLSLDSRTGDGYSAIGGSIRALYEF